jgi:hypothetical protein
MFEAHDLLVFLLRLLSHLPNLGLLSLGLPFLDLLYLLLLRKALSDNFELFDLLLLLPLFFFEGHFLGIFILFVLFLLASVEQTTLYPFDLLLINHQTSLRSASLFSLPVFNSF